MNFKGGTNMSQDEKFKLINLEVRSFYEYCREAGMGDEEIEVLCRPLTNAVRKAAIKRWTRFLLVVIMIVAVGYTVSQTETFQWHATAAARIVLMRLLPVWDWTPLYYNQCLLERAQPQNVENTMTTDACITCEAIKSVNRISDTSYTEVFHHNLMRGAPVIVTDAYVDWLPTEFNLTSLMNNDDRLLNSVPCRILTNMRIGRQPMDLEEIVSRITNNNVPNWFVHFQNCDLIAVKAFRILAPRPYFLSPHIPPSHFNWLLISNKYDTHRYKQLELDIGLIIMSQIKGKNKVSLKPRSPCDSECFKLDVVLTEGETLVLANSLWEFEYLPDKHGVNVAMITETDWIDA